ncbi:hypothetical protein EON66_06250 [archaeon]|nr:MAG: hypothetical protein EON66_06250 [archaeon]
MAPCPEPAPTVAAQHHQAKTGEQPVSSSVNKNGEHSDTSMQAGNTMAIAGTGATALIALGAAAVWWLKRQQSHAADGTDAHELLASEAQATVDTTNITSSATSEVMSMADLVDRNEPGQPLPSPTQPVTVGGDEDSTPALLSPTTGMVHKRVPTTVCVRTRARVQPYPRADVLCTTGIERLGARGFAVRGKAHQAR